MGPFLFVLGLGIFMVLVLGWGFKHLPGEEWQMAAAVPLRKNGNGSWQGLNLTWYGLLSAAACAFSVAVLLILAGGAGIPMSALLILTVLLLAVTIPASKIVARIVEKKQATLTVGGAVFVGTITGPFIILLVNQTAGRLMGFYVDVFVMLAAVSIAYAYGESLGRLACLSFGCCYGKPLKECAPFTRRLFSKWYVVFTGKTKKIAYASGLDGEKMIPIQMMTSMVYGVSALLGTWLYLEGFIRAAFLETLIITQAWRVISEFFRADFRGELKFSMYQYMALGAIAYSCALAVLLPLGLVTMDLGTGIKSIWDPGILLFIQLVWLAGVWHSGRSTVTDAEIRFNVVRDKI